MCAGRVFSQTPPPQSGATYNFYPLNRLYPPQQESSIANSIKNWAGAMDISKTLPLPISTIRKSIHENADCKDKILTERSATARQGIGEEFHYRGGDHSKDSGREIFR